MGAVITLTPVGKTEQLADTLEQDRAILHRDN